MSLLMSVAAVLRQRSLPFAMIGAGAMAVHGVSRSTADVDLLTTDAACLDTDLWSPLAPPIAVDIRRGDAGDPLAGVVRFRSPGETDVDVVVARHAWQTDCLQRASLTTVDQVPVVSLPDLILLKLYAGGSQDGWDIEQLLAADVTGSAARDVEARLDALPRDAKAFWRRIRGG